jgi:glutathione peroxidase
MFAGLIKAGAKSPGWNFNKYLIDRDGKLAASFGSSTRPDEKAFISALEKALASQ